MKKYYYLAGGAMAAALLGATVTGNQLASGLSEALVEPVRHESNPVGFTWRPSFPGADLGTNTFRFLAEGNVAQQPS